MNERKMNEWKKERKKENGVSGDLKSGKSDELGKTPKTCKSYITFTHLGENGIEKALL